MNKNKYDCIVVGAGHAGVEAAHAAAKMGLKTVLITISKQTIATMSCNPAIGGSAKGQIVREVDALGGLMGRATDDTGIQFRLLNRSRGPAIRAPRAQADKYKYSLWMAEYLLNTSNLDIIEAMVTDIIIEDSRLRAVACGNGEIFYADTAIVTTGTFLRGLMHIGTEQFKGGRIGEPPSEHLPLALQRIGLKLGRLKTGTPPRLDPSTVNLEKLEVQHGDTDPQPFSFMTEKINRKQIPCWVTYTNKEIHKILTDNLDRAPLYTGQIKSTGPRYCPSIEGKIIRFPDKDRHQVFLEPEDEQISSIYCNGISTSVPKDIQRQILNLMPGTENARIIRYGYAIEYDYCPPTQLKNNLETKKIKGLFLAGQINGTSGYEEAAGQGIVAGINAAKKLQNAEPLILKRNQAYIGVMIDDLMTKGIDEPYRMFTSRAEFRIALRYDNADRRLTQIARDLGLVDDNRWEKFQAKINNIEKLKEYLHNTRCDGTTLWQMLKQPDSNFSEKIADHPQICKFGFSKEVVETVKFDAKYEGYIRKQKRLIQNFACMENKKIPQALDYNTIEHLRAEAKEKLTAFQPGTLAQAGRISGITPADITVIQIHLKKYY